MAVETYLISLEEKTSPQELEQILRTLHRIGGKVNMAAKKFIIATFDNAYIDIIRKQRGVRLVGGVNFRGRKIKRVVREKQCRD